MKRFTFSHCSLRHVLSTGLALSLLATGVWAQIPKLPTKVKEVKETATQAKEKASEASGAASEASGVDAGKAQYVEGHFKELETALGSGKLTESWNDEHRYKLQHCAQDVASLKKGSPAEMAMAEKYEKRYRTLLTQYQDNMPLHDAIIYIPAKAPDQEKAFEEAFLEVRNRLGDIVRALKDPAWWNQNWVNSFNQMCTNLTDRINAAKPLDPENYMRLDRYTAAQAEQVKLYESKKGLPAEWSKAMAFFESKSQYMNNVKYAEGKNFPEHLALLENVKNLDVAQMNKHIAFFHANNFPFSGDRSSMGQQEFENFYKNWGDAGKGRGTLQAQITEAMSTAKTHRHAWMQWNAIQRVNALAEAGVLLAAGHAPFKATLDESATLMPEKKAAWEKATFTSEFHKSHVGQIGFSATGPTGFAEKKAFKAGDVIHITLFADRPLLYVANAEGEISLGFEGTSDENNLGGVLKLSPAQLELAYLDFTVNAQNPYENSDYVEEEFLRELCRLAAKSGQVKVNMTGSQASHSFSFDGANTAGITQYKNRWLPMYNKRNADSRMPAAVQSDAALEAEMKRIFKAQYSDCEAVLKVNILDKDWSMIRNELTGILVAREITACVAYKRIDGTWRYEKCAFEQEHKGGGAWGVMYFDGVYTNDEICEQWIK